MPKLSGMYPDQRLIGQARGSAGIRCRLGGAPDLQEAHASRAGRGDVIDHKRGPAAAAEVAELLARGHVETSHVDRAQLGVVAEADRLDLGLPSGWMAASRPSRWLTR